MTEPATAPDVLRFEADTGVERREAMLRVGLAILVLFASLWLLATPGWVLRGLAAMSGAYALLWLSRSLRTLLEPASLAARDALELAPQGLCQTSRGEARHVDWRQVAAVRIDEDRLTIVLELHTGAEVEVPPRYPGVPLHELGEAIARFHARFRSTPGETSEPPATTQERVSKGACRTGDG